MFPKAKKWLSTLLFLSSLFVTESEVSIIRSLYDISISLFLIPIGKKEFKRNERKFNEV